MARNGDVRGLLSSLAGMPGASTKTEEQVHVQFDAAAIEKAIESIRQLQGTGALTINFHNGKPNGKAAWKPALPKNS